jgi:hypothetical protein
VVQAPKFMEKREKICSETTFSEVQSVPIQAPKFIYGVCFPCYSSPPASPALLADPPLGRAVSFSGKPGFCRGSAPVPTLPIQDLQAFQGLGLFTREEPLQRMKQPCPLGGKALGMDSLVPHLLDQRYIFFS